MEAQEIAKSHCRRLQVAHRRTSDAGRSHPTTHKHELTALHEASQGAGATFNMAIRFARTTLKRVNASASSIRTWPLTLSVNYCGSFQFRSATDHPDSSWRSSSFVLRHVSNTPVTAKLRPITKHLAGKRKPKRDTGERGSIVSEKSKRTTQIHQLKRKIKDLSEGVQVQPGKDKRRPSQQLKSSIKMPSPEIIQGPFSAFVSCLPGLEPYLLQEVQYLLASTTQQSKLSVPLAVPGGVKVVVPTLAYLYLLHLYLGTASHIYLRLNDAGIANSTGIPPLFRARGFPELQRKLKDLILSQRWDMLLNVHRSSIGETRSEGSLPWQLKVHVTTSKSKLIHTKAVEERVRQTIGETLGINGLESSANSTAVDSDRHSTNKNARDRPVVRLLVRIDRDEVQLSLDTSSSSSATPLHMRGYRLNPHKAPLREDIAFALLMAGGLKPSWNLQHLRPLFGAVSETQVIAETIPGQRLQVFDPFCGSGTLAIEAASILASLPPGRFRQPPFLGTKLCNLGLWDGVKAKALTATEDNSRRSILVLASDISTEAINAAKSNSKRAGVDQFIDFSVGSFNIHPVINQSRSSALSVSRSQPLVVVTNPPYGYRLSTDATQSSIYKQIAKALRSLPCKVQCTMIGNDPRTLRESSLPLEVAFSTKHGGMSVVAMTGFIDN